MNADLLAIIESGKPGRFDNALRPTILPKGHRFTVTCGCADCDHVWNAYEPETWKKPEVTR